MDAILALIPALAAKYPIVVSVLSAMGFLRLFFKPLFTFLHAYTDATANPNDNAALLKVESSKWYAAFVWLLDFFGSVKLQKPE